MSIRVKDIGAASKKFVQRASAATPDYTEGVKSAGADWEQNTRAGADNYKAAVVQAASEGRFEKGVSQAGAQKYQQRAQTLGSQRYGPGVQASESEYARNTAPYLQTIASMTLPPRRPKGDPGNMQRSQAVAAALRAQKLGK